MAVNKNFVVKNGLEVASNLILADAATNKVGIGTTVPLKDFDVRGDVSVSGVTTTQHLLVTGISTFTGLSTFSGGVEFLGAGATSTTLSVSGVSTFTGNIDANGDLDVDGHTELDNVNVSGFSTFVGFATFQDNVFVQGITNSGITTSNEYTVDGTTVINSSRELQNIASLDATTTATIEAAISNAPNTFDDLTVTGVSTFVGIATFGSGIEVTSGISTFAGIGTFGSDVFIDGNLNVAGIITYASATATNINVTGIATVGTTLDVNGDLDVDGHTELDNVNVSGVATITSLDVLTDFDVYDTQAVFHNDLRINGNLSIGGTATTLIAEDLFVIDKNIVLGITTTLLNVDISTDDTANGGGIAIASTEGNPLVSLFVAGINTFPNTYKQLLWSKANSYGFGTTDAWMFNYAVGIGSTLVPNGVRFAVKEIQFTDDTINTPNINVAQNLNVSATSTLGIASVSQLYVSGVSTFTGDIDANGSIDVDGHTELDDLNVSGVSTFAGITTHTASLFGTQLSLTGVVTAAGGFNIGIQSAGIDVATGVITALNFIGAGNTFEYNAGTKTIDISIQGGGGGAGAGGTWATYTAGIATSKSVGVNTSTLDDSDLTGIGNSFQGLYVGNGMIIVDNQLNGDHYIGTNFNGLMAGPVTVNGTLTVDGNWVVV
jgi:hypothetical protein